MAALSHTGDFTYGWIQNLFVYHNYMVGLGCVFSPPYCLLLLHLAIYFDARGLVLEHAIQLVVSCSQTEVNNIKCQQNKHCS